MNRTSHRIAVAVTLLLFPLLCPFPVPAQAPPVELTQVQGKLLDSNNLPVNGSLPFRLAFFDAPVGGTLLLTDVHEGAAAVTVSDGIYSLKAGGGELVAGAVSSYGDLFVNRTEIWVETIIDGDVLQPRVQLLSSPTAINSLRLNSQSSDFFLDRSAAPQSKAGALNVEGVLSAADKLGVGTSNPQARLEIAGDGETILFPRTSGMGDPAGVDGMVYYNIARAAFRAFEGGAWKNLIGGTNGGGGGGGGGGTKAEVSEPYLVAAASPSLTAERVLRVSNGLSLFDGGPESVLTIGLRLNASGGLSSSLGGSLNELGIAEGGVTGGMVLNGTLRDEDLSPTAAISDSKLAVIASPGKVADTALSSNVTLLGQTIDLGTGEVTGVLSDASLPSNVTRLGPSIDLGTETAGVLPMAQGGTGASALAAGSVLYSDGAAIGQDNANLFWDAANRRLGVGTSAPSSRLHVPWHANGFAPTVDAGSADPDNATIAIRGTNYGPAAPAVAGVSTSGIGVSGSSVTGSGGTFGSTFGTALFVGETGPLYQERTAPTVHFFRNHEFPPDFNDDPRLAKGPILRVEQLESGGSGDFLQVVCDFETCFVVASNNSVGIGTSTPQARLEIAGDGKTVLFPRKSTSDDPAGADGMVYYNAALNVFRAFEGGAWRSLGTTGSGGSGAPSGASYLVRALDPALTNERALAAAAPLTLTDAGPNNNLTLGLGVVGLANGGTGSTAFPAGRIVFSNGSALTHDAGLAWDNSLKRLVLSDGIVSTGISSPSGTSVTIDSANDVTVINDNNLRLAGPGGHLISNDFGDGFNLTLDSANGRIHLFDPLVFAGAGADPAPAVNGEVYYNTASNRLRVFQGGAWSDIGGSGTVTQVNTGSGLTGGPITSTGTISIAAGGVTNAMLANSSVTVAAGSGLTGGGTISLGGSASLSVASGGITSSHIAGATRFVSVQNSAAAEQFAVTNASPALQFAGSGATSVAFDAVNRRVTISSTDTNSGGTVTQVNTGTGLTGGPINTSGTISLDAAHQSGSAYDARFVNATGDTLTGALTLSGVNLDVTGGGQVRFTQSGSGNARFAESWGIRFSSTDASPGVTQHHLSTDSSLLVGHALTGANLGRGNLYVQNAAGIGTGASATPPNRLSVFTPNSVDGISLDGSVNPAMLLRASGTVRGYIAIPTTAGAYTPGAGLGDIVFRSEFGRLLFTDNAGATTAMTITTLTTGANTNAYVSLAGGGDPPASFRNVVGNAIAGQTTTQPSQGIFLGASEAASSGVIGVRDNSHFIKIDSGTNRMTFQEFGEFVWQNGSGTSPVVRMRLDASGNLTATGTKSAVVDTATHGRRTLYAVEAADVRFTDEGDGTLSGGAARVDLDPVFVETIEGALRVHVTPHGPVTLYVAERGADYFVVKSADGSDVSFDWQVSAARRGFANVRLAETPVSDPAPPGE